VSRLIIRRGVSKGLGDFRLHIYKKRQNSTQHLVGVRARVLGAGSQQVLGVVSSGVGVLGPDLCLGGKRPPPNRRCRHSQSQSHPRSFTLLPSHSHPHSRSHSHSHPYPHPLSHPHPLSLTLAPSHSHPLSLSLSHTDLWLPGTRSLPNRRRCLSHSHSHSHPLSFTLTLSLPPSHPLSLSHTDLCLGGKCPPPKRRRRCLRHNARADLSGWGEGGVRFSFILVY